MNQQRQALIKELYGAIERGEIVRGQQLLTERELCERFNVKRSLLREAKATRANSARFDIPAALSLRFFPTCFSINAIVRRDGCKIAGNLENMIAIGLIF